VLPQRSTSGAGRVKLGELLVKAGVITDSQLKTALGEQRQWGGKLGDILVRMRYLSEDVFVRALSKQLGIPRADLTGQTPIPPEALARVPAEVAEEYEIVPCALLEDGKTLAIATSDPLNLTVVDAVRVVANCRVVSYVAGASAIRAAISRLYQGEEVPREDAGQMRILANGEDIAAAQAAENATRQPPPGYAPPAPYAAHPTPYAAGLPPGADPNGTNPNLRAVFLGGGGAPSAYASAPAPASASAPIPAPERASDEAPRREAAAIKALVELLVQKGIISLDEYLARLKR
jgi:hypothetical protein